MNRDQAKEVLMVYRPGSADEEAPEFFGALELAKTDPGLREWFQEHCVSYGLIRDKLRALPPPPDLKARILSGRKTIPLFPNRIQPLLWAAAAVALLIGLLLIVRQGEVTSDRFAHFRGRMVGLALRQYGMDMVTNRADVLRQFLSDQGRPSDYVLPQKLERLTLSGGGALTWRSNPVSMICFDRGDRQMLFLFVIDSSSLKAAPSEDPEVKRVNRLMTVGWSRGGRTYLLAGPEEDGFAEKYR